MVILQIMVMLIILISLIWMYFLHVGNKSKEIMKILDDEICPRCNNMNLIIDKQGNGCSGTDNWNVKCPDCDFNESYTVPNDGSCSI